MSNSLVHLAVNGATYATFVLAGLVSFDRAALFWFLFAGVVFDLDHAFYFLATTRPLTREKLAVRLKHDYENRVPHFYAFHDVEFAAATWVLAIAFPGNSPMFWIALGWSSHLLVDAASYIAYYRSLHPWAAYFSAAYYFLAGRDRLGPPSGGPDSGDG
ncbi:MAG: hypothetical protein ACTSU5_13840 [Promethearchaeota archaeon]